MGLATIDESEPSLDLVISQAMEACQDGRSRGGDQVAVSANGEYILPGFSGSAVSSLEIRVDHYLALWSMIRNSYQGRLVDILDVGV